MSRNVLSREFFFFFNRRIQSVFRECSLAAGLNKLLVCDSDMFFEIQFFFLIFWSCYTACGILAP